MEDKDEIIFREPRKTFMEILKVNNREVPFANVLAFFFRPNENHKLGTLFIDALLETKFTNIGKIENKEITQKTPVYEKNSVKVIVEQKTKCENRIDILVITNTFVICIEFKINHDLNNPLDDYKVYVEKEFNEKQKFYFILTPYKKEAIEKAKDYFDKNNEFKQIVLRHFINRVKEKIEENPTTYLRNEKYDYFLDFIQTVENREIRSKRNLFLEKLKKDLSKNVKSEYHKNINGGFLEIEKEKFNLKVRFTKEGIQIEKWENKSFDKIIYEPNKTLNTKSLIKQIAITK
jgi:hypothetical protein